MSKNKKKRALVVQGGGFRTAFTAGVLDALMVAGDQDFDSYVAVSGGSIAISYFLSGQYGYCYEAMRLLAKDPHFVKFSRAMSDAGYMDVDYMERIAAHILPFDKIAALSAVQDKNLRFVATLRETGEAVYLRPDKENWLQSIIASCTLPFITKGKHAMDGVDYFDGGWSAPVPVKFVYEQGAEEIVVIRTTRPDTRITQSWPDYFGSIYFRSHKGLSHCFENAHHIYNESLEYIDTLSQHTSVIQIAPETPLKCGTYSYSVDALTQDYRHGLEAGIDYLQSQQERGEIQ